MKKKSSNNKYKTVLIIFIFLLFLIALILRQKSENDEGPNHFILLEKPIKLPENILNLEDDIYSNHLYILFSLKDCPLCLYEAEFWSKAQEGNKISLELIGVTDEIDTIKLAQFVDEYKLDFKLYNGQNYFNDFKKYLKNNGYEFKTPLKLFVNKNNELFAIERGTKDFTIQKDFPVHIQKIFAKEL